MAEKKNKKDILDKEAKEENVAVNSETESQGPETAQAESMNEASGNEKLAEGEAQQTVESVEDLKSQIANWNDRYLRLMAEFDNYKKRSSRDYQAMVDSANERLMTDLVEVRENFERAVKNGEQSTDYKTLFDGVKLIYNKFDTVLSKHGLETFGSAGEPFDPMQHDALMKAPHAQIPEDHIADIYERGYRLKGKIMKHARVIVSSGKPIGNATEEKSDK
jgi:molecular chaperone GrpE